MFLRKRGPMATLPQAESWRRPARIDGLTLLPQTPGPRAASATAVSNDRCCACSFELRELICGGLHFGGHCTSGGLSAVGHSLGLAVRKPWAPTRGTRAEGNDNWRRDVPCVGGGGLGVCLNCVQQVPACVWQQAATLLVVVLQCWVAAWAFGGRLALATAQFRKRRR